MRAFTLSLLLLACSCRHVGIDIARVASAPTEVIFDMPSDGVGHLSFHVQSPAGTIVAQVEWSLLIDGVQVASGLDGAPTVTGREVYVNVPVVIHHLQWKDGAAYVQLSLRGGLLLGAADGAERLPFSFSEERLTRGHFDSHASTH